MDRFEALKILDFDHLEFAVSDLNKASNLYVRMGFEKVGSREILERQLESRLFAQNGIYILLSHSTLRNDPVTQHLIQHGEGIYNVGFLCEDAVTTLDIAANRGAEVVESPRTYRKDFGTVQSAAVRAFGSVRHTFISRKGSFFAEGFSLPVRAPKRAPGLQKIDHLTYSVEPNQVDAWCDFYERVLGLERRISGAPGSFDGNRSRVMESPNGVIRIPVNQSVNGFDQVQEYLNINHGPGITYVALLTDNIISCLRSLRREGIPFLQSPPSSYYDSLRHRIPQFTEEPSELAELGILMDGSERGYLLQTFTQGLMGPFFYQLLQRKGDRGFGEGNFLTLFNSRDHGTPTDGLT